MRATSGSMVLALAAALMVGVALSMLHGYACVTHRGDQVVLGMAITMTADGRLLIQTTETPPEELIQRLTAIAAERTSDKIFLRADGAIPYARVAEVMGALNAGGFNNIGLVTDAQGPSFGADAVVAPAGTDG